MKTSEFIEEVEKLEFVDRVSVLSYGRIYIQDENDETIAQTNSQNRGVIDTNNTSFNFLTIKKKEQLFNLLVEYAATPIEERKDKTIEDKAREYIQECINENHNFYSCVDNLLFNAGNDRESEIYLYYQTNSNEFVKLWCEVAADEH